MSAIRSQHGWIVSCDGERCPCYEWGPTLVLAAAQVTREGWETRPTVTVIDGVPRQRVEHYCPQHGVGAR